MKLGDIITSLSILRDQLAAKGHDAGEIDELTFTAECVRLKRGTKTLKIPLITMNLKQGGK